MILQTLLNLPIKTHDLIKSINLLAKKWKGVISGKKYSRWFAVSSCPPRQVLAGPDMSDFRLLVQFCIIWVQNWTFEEV